MRRSLGTRTLACPRPARGIGTSIAAGQPVGPAFGIGKPLLGSGRPGPG